MQRLFVYFRFTILTNTQPLRGSAHHHWLLFVNCVHFLLIDAAKFENNFSILQNYFQIYF